jgi:broad specificity phosphatase PhoE
MPKILHFVRHAHGEHNAVGEVDRAQYLREDLEDAHVSKLGVSQCSNLGSMNMLSNAKLLLTSPMRRTLYTATHSFPHLVDSIPWVALESIRETTGIHPCDRRLPISQHSQVYSHVDFANVEHDMDPLFHLYDTREPEHDVEKRAMEFLEWVKGRDEDEIIVVTHSAFLRVLHQRILLPERDHSRFDNCEIRSVVVDWEPDGGGIITTPLRP